MSPIPSLPHSSSLWIAAGIAVVLAGYFSAFLVLLRKRSAVYASLAKTLPGQLLAAEQEKLPLVPVDIRPLVPVPDAENAAPFYYQLSEIVKRRTRKEADAEDDLLRAFLRGPNRTAAQRMEIKATLERAAPRLMLAEQAASRPHCDFARPWEQGIDVELAPEYTAIRTTARLFAARALLYKDENKPELALRDIRVGARLGRHAASDPVMLSLLVDSAIKMIIHRAFVEILKQYGDRREILQQASLVHQEFEPVPDVQQAFSGEMLIGRASLEKQRHSPNAVKGRVREDGIRVWPRNDRQKQEEIDALESQMIAYWRRVYEALRAASGDLKKQGDAFAQIQAEIASRKKQPGYERNADYTQIFISIPVKVMQCKAHNRLQSRLIALLQYRIEHGAFPDSLVVLPSPDDNTDPFTNRSLLYRRTPEGFLIYSVGQDGKDDGGSEKLDATNWPEDIVIRYP